MDYAYSKRLATQSFEHARDAVARELAAEGFGILSEIDVSATLKHKIGADFRPYVILGACNPQLAHRALQAEPRIGALLPCNVVLQAIDAGVQVDIANPRTMFGMIESRDLEPVVNDADQRLRRVLERLH